MRKRTSWCRRIRFWGDFVKGYLNRCSFVLSISKERGKTCTEGRPIGNLVINTTLNDAGVNKGITYRNNLKTARTATKATVQEFKAMGDELTASKKKLKVCQMSFLFKKRSSTNTVSHMRNRWSNTVRGLNRRRNTPSGSILRFNPIILYKALRRAQVQYEQLEQAQREAGKSADSLSDSQKDIGEATETAKGKVGKFSSFIEVTGRALTAGEP